MAARPCGRASGAMIAVLLTFLATLPVQAQAILRDAELESALRELARPVISASGLHAASMRILVLQDSSLNAFVLNGQTIVIHSGLLLKMNKPEMLQGVIAHEIAHIANGHLTRRPENLRNARTSSIIGLARNDARSTAQNDFQFLSTSTL